MLKALIFAAMIGWSGSLQAVTVEGPVTIYAPIVDVNGQTIASDVQVRLLWGYQSGVHDAGVMNLTMGPGEVRTVQVTVDVPDQSGQLVYFSGTAENADGISALADEIAILYEWTETPIPGAPGPITIEIGQDGWQRVECPANYTCELVLTPQNP